jgi:adenylate cyclase
MISLGGFRQSSAVVVWAALSPLGALLIDDLRGTLFWIAGFIALLIVGAILEPYLPQANLPQAFIASFYVLNVGVVISIAFGLLYYFVDRRNFFQQRSEMLLLNILPKEISEAFKASPRTIADEYTAASILFADVVEFTPMAAGMTPLQLVDLLNEVFQCFDDLVEKYDLEKIKTIGDCYMVASGVPCPRPDHAVASTGRTRDRTRPSASSNLGSLKRSPRTITAQAIRAILLARGTAATLIGRRSMMRISQRRVVPWRLHIG